MKTHKILALVCLLSLMGQIAPAHSAEQLEVLHWWTSESEAKAARVLKEAMEKQGYQWKDFAVAGGGGTAAMTVLKTKIISGNAPSATEIKGPMIQQWAEQKVLVNLDAAAQDWAAHLPEPIDKTLRYQGHYVAAPFSVHRMNWLWINAHALKQVNGQVPKNWTDFFALADKFKAAGYLPIAHGGQPWQDLTIWETVVLSQGPAFYRKALVELDQETLSSPQMIEVFNITRKISTYFDKGRAGRAWNLATAMVINGKAGMQFMGDFAKGEFVNAGKTVGQDYLCSPVPGTAQAYLFNLDSFVFFTQRNHKQATQGQLSMAKTIGSPAFEEQFALYKGAIPARLDVSMAKFDGCAKQSYQDAKTAIRHNSYLPSLAHGMAQSEAVAGAISDVVTHFINSDQDAKTAVRELARVAKK